MAMAHEQESVGSRQRFGVITISEHPLTFVPHHDRGAGVLASGKHTAGGDVGVAKQLHRHELVVGGRLRVVDDFAELGEVPWAKQVRDIVKCLT